MASIETGRIDRDTVNALARRLKMALTASGVDLQGPPAIERYLESFAPLKEPIAYDHVPPAAKALVRTVEATAGPAMVETYHQLVLVTLIQSFEQRTSGIRLPADVMAHSIDYLEDLVRRLEKPRQGQYRLDKDAFLKDLSVARLKLWPCGAELVDIASGIPRRMLLEGGKAAFFLALGQIKFQCGGFKPFFETHFDSRLTGNFSAEGYRSLYLTVAQMLDEAPEVKGLYSCSWWHDPAVAAISPNLAFLNAIAIEGGAKLYPMGTDEQVIAQATRLSPERTQQMRANTYHPARYLMVWARKDLLSWAKGRTTDQREAVVA